MLSAGTLIARLVRARGDFDPPAFRLKAPHWDGRIDSPSPTAVLDSSTSVAANCAAFSSGKDCIRQFKAAWERFAVDEANLTEFLT